MNLGPVHPSKNISKEENGIFFLANEDTLGISTYEYIQPNSDKDKGFVFGLLTPP